MADQITLRTATLTDVRVLTHWDSLPHVLEATGRDPGEPSAWDWPKEIPRIVSWRELLIAESGGKSVGFVQIIDPHEEETSYWGDCEPNLRAIDIWIGEPEFLGKGLGTQMMQLALERCFGAPAVTAVLIDPFVWNERAIRFYKHFGFVVVERRQIEGDFCLIMRLERSSFQRNQM